MTPGQNIQGHAHNALAEALAEFMPLSERERLSAAVVAGVEPIIRTYERQRFVAAAESFPEPFKSIITGVARGE